VIKRFDSVLRHAITAPNPIQLTGDSRVLTWSFISLSGLWPAFTRRADYKPLLFKPKFQSTMLLTSIVSSSSSHKFPIHFHFSETVNFLASLFSSQPHQNPISDDRHSHLLAEIANPFHLLNLNCIRYQFPPIQLRFLYLNSRISFLFWIWTLRVCVLCYCFSFAISI
jgi:hypothetical protein